MARPTRSPTAAAPSVLNGRLGGGAGGLAAVFLGAAAAGSGRAGRWRRDDRRRLQARCELGFDPLGVYGDDPATRKARRRRLARARIMVAVLGSCCAARTSRSRASRWLVFAPPWETAAALFGGAAP